jgi:deazaflavin-dependent oxidoreductase (nitroreductase family)
VNKRRASTFLTVRIVNPVVRWAASRGLAGGSVALLETTGRKSGQKRVTPVGNGLRGREFWIITEHGWSSAYVKNIQADPRVRVKVGRRWMSGTATILPDDDPYERMRRLKRANDAAVRLMGTQHLVIRVDLG